MINVDGTGRQKVTHEAVGLWAFNWSNDGKQLAYAPDTIGTIRIVNAKTKERLVDAVVKDENRSFKLLRRSPDGSCIACITTAGTLYLFDLDKKQFTLLGEHASTHNEHFAWSAESKRIAYIKENVSKSSDHSTNDLCITTIRGNTRVIAKVRQCQAIMERIGDWYLSRRTIFKD